MIKRRITRLTIAIIVAISGLAALTAGSALAAPGIRTSIVAMHTATDSTLVSCSFANGERVRQASWTNGNETRTVY